MNDKRFVTLAIEFESLRTELHRANDPIFRKLLLIELRDKLEEIEQMAKTVREDLPEPPERRPFSN